MTDQKTEQKPADHKAIREAAEEGPYYTAMVAKPDLRALLADLDAMRGALRELSDMYARTWDKVDGGLAMFSDSMKRFEKAHARAHAALKGADSHE